MHTSKQIASNQGKLQQLRCVRRVDTEAFCRISTSTRPMRPGRRCNVCHQNLSICFRANWPFQVQVSAGVSSNAPRPDTPGLTGTQSPLTSSGPLKTYVNRGNDDSITPRSFGELPSSTTRTWHTLGRATPPAGPCGRGPSKA